MIGWAKWSRQWSCWTLWATGTLATSLCCTPNRAGKPPPAKPTSAEPETLPKTTAGSSGASFRPHARCDTNLERCRLVLEVLDLLDRGRAEEALVLMQNSSRIAPYDEEPQAELELELLVLEGRAQLESGSLAFGEGGKEAQAALMTLGRALRISGGSEKIRFQMARAYLALGKASEALVELEHLGAESAKDAEMQAALGIVYIALGRSEQSLRPLIKASELDPEEPERWIVLGTAYLLCGNTSAAERAYRRALALAPRSPRAHGDLGVLLAAEGRVDEAKGHLVRACSLAPERATHWSNLSYVEHLLGDQERARSHIDRALELDPQLSSAWLNLGLIQVENHEFADARASFLKAQSLDPSDPRPQNNLSDLAELEAENPSDSSP